MYSSQFVSECFHTVKNLLAAPCAMTIIVRHTNKNVNPPSRKRFWPFPNCGPRSMVDIVHTIKLIQPLFPSKEKQLNASSVINQQLCPFISFRQRVEYIGKVQAFFANNFFLIR